MAKLKLSTILAALKSKDLSILDTVVWACAETVIPKEQIEEWLVLKVSNDFSGSWWNYVAGLAACAKADFCEQELMDISHDCAQKLDRRVVGMPGEMLGNAFSLHGISEAATEEMMTSPSWLDNYCALRAWEGRESPFWLIQKGLDKSDPWLKKVASSLCQYVDIGRSTLEAWRKSDDISYQRAAMAGAIGSHEVPFKWLAEGLESPAPGIRRLAAQAVAKRKIPEKYLKKWALPRDDRADTYLAMIWNFEEHEKAWAEWRSEKRARRWLKWLETLAEYANSWRVRAEATRILGVQNLPNLTQDAKPGIGFTRGLGGVVAIVGIPKTAQIIGGGRAWYRASEAKVVMIEGNFYGEEVVIPGHDHKTAYRKGDEVVVENFDPNPFEVATTGFRFVKRRADLLKLYC